MPDPIREIVIQDLSELIQVVTPSRPDPASGRLRERAVYRGVPDTGYSLLTSLARVGVPDREPHSKVHLEEHLLRNFIRYSRPHLSVAPVNDWEVLIVAQHHGLPTRLLDWTHSPLVAAHFATVNEGRPSDRVIWRLDWGAMHDYYGLPPLALMVHELDAVLEKRGITSLWQLVTDQARLEEPLIALLEPPALDGRITSQASTFTFPTDRTRAIDELLAEAGLSRCLTRIQIPYSAVERVRDQLDLCGVDERRLFPDLDGVAAEMRRYYSASGLDPSRPLDEQQD
ncbi:MAG: FRG domain-containing protein [Armatimonadota bacterium]